MYYKYNTIPMNRPTFTFSRPEWLQTSHPAFRAIVALLTTLFIAIQFFGNMPTSALRQTTMHWRVFFDNLGLYQKGWGMFAASNSHTSTARIEMRYTNGEVDHIQYIHFASGFAITPWNEVMQDLQYDDNNDVEGRYLTGFLNYSCKQYDLPNNHLQSISFQQQFVSFPYSKALAAENQPFVTKKTQTCAN